MTTNALKFEICDENNVGQKNPLNRLTFENGKCDEYTSFSPFHLPFVHRRAISNRAYSLQTKCI